MINFILILTTVISIASSLRKIMTAKNNKVDRKKAIERLIEKKQSSNESNNQSIFLKVGSKIDNSLSNSSLGKIGDHFGLKFNLPKDLSAGNIVVLNIVLAFSLFFISIILKINFLTAFIFCLFIESIILAVIANKYSSQQVLIANLPQLLEYMAKIYRVYPDLKECILQTSNLVDNKQLKQILGRVYQLSNLGLSTVEALEKLAIQVDHPDFNFVLSSIKINQPLGGDLADLFEKTAKSLRLRKQTKKDIKNLLFQNKITAIISSLMVPGIFIGSLLFSKNYKMAITSVESMKLVLIIAFFWWLIGVVMISRITRVKV